MPARLITWWNKNNAWHIAAAAAVLKSLGAKWSAPDAHCGGAVVVGGGELQLSSAGAYQRTIDAPAASVLAKTAEAPSHTS